MLHPCSEIGTLISTIKSCKNKMLIFYAFMLKNMKLIDVDVLSEII